MKIECKNCHTTFDLPDERLPKGQEISFPCPKCKESIKLDLRSKTPEGATTPPEAEQETGAPSEASAEPLLTGEELKKQVLGSVKTLPAMPQTVHKAREIMENPSASFKDLAKVIEVDQAIATKILKISNSTYYGLSGRVSSIQHASVVLGQKTLGEIISMAGTSDVLDEILEGYELESGDLWRHSMGVAFGSRMIAAKKNPGLANDAFSAGLIHDSGKLILDPYILERKKAFTQFLSDGEQSFLAAEKALLGFDHPEIASEVCKSWNMPETLVTAIRYHHSPSESEGDELCYIIHMADAIAMMTGLGVGMDGMQYEMDPKAMEILDIDQDEVSDFMTQVLESVESTVGQMQSGD